jgi:hypothetical protein
MKSDKLGVTRIGPQITSDYFWIRQLVFVARNLRHFAQSEGA